MTISDAALVAVQFWPRDNAVIMVAIAGPESGYRNDVPSSTDVWGMRGEQDWWRAYSCGRVYSWGLWQIFMPAHHERLLILTGSDDPCVWADWLKVPLNNASIAYQIWQAQGFQAWTAYNNDAYLAYKPGAELAVDLALGLAPPVVVPLPAAVAPPWQAVAPPSMPVSPPPSL